MFTFQPIQRCISSSIDLFKFWIALCFFNLLNMNSLVFFVCSIWIIALYFFNVHLIYANRSAPESVCSVKKNNHVHKRKWNPFWLKCMQKKIFFGWKKNIKNTLMWEKKIFSISFLAFKIISWNSKLSLDPPTHYFIPSSISETCVVK
jgi:hypothetical protein